MKALAREFYQQSTTEVARALLGCYVIHEGEQGKTIGRIVETEAYLANDPASHSYKGESKRNKAMFGEAGQAYFYLIYGIHYCFNVVTASPGVGEAVLIRALEPITGIALMQERRGLQDVIKLCNGPAKLVQALGIGMQFNHADLTHPPLYIASDSSAKITSIVATTRIGITLAADQPLRFYLKDSPYISKP